MRMCACRGTAGFAHVSCLAEQAKILLAEVEENNLDTKVLNERFRRWDTCSLCKQEYHGVVRHGLGWACWKTYVGRPDKQGIRLHAMQMLASGLKNRGNMENDDEQAKKNYYNEAVNVQEKVVEARKRYEPHSSLLMSQNNLAGLYFDVGRRVEAVSMQRLVYEGRLAMHGPTHPETLMGAQNYAMLLQHSGRSAEAVPFLRERIMEATSALGENHLVTIDLHVVLAGALLESAMSLSEPISTGKYFAYCQDAVTIYEKAVRFYRRVLGPEHPKTAAIESIWRTAARSAHHAREASVSRTVGSLCDAVDALNT